MAVTVTVERFATPTTTGNVTWTDTNLGGLTPKAVMIIANHADTDGTAEDGLALGIGFATGASNEVSCSISSQHNVTTTNSDRHQDTGNVIDLLVDGSVQVTANFVSFGVNSVTLNFTAVDTDAQLFTVVFFAGDDLTAHADFITLGGAGVGIDVTAPGFEPDLVIASTAFSLSGTAAIAWFTFGACVNDGADTQKCLSWGSSNGASTSAIGSILVSDEIGRFTDPALDSTEITCSDFDASGFTITPDDSNSNGVEYFYLALSFGGAASSSVRSFDSPTSTGNDARTGVGFAPQFVLFGLTDAQAENVRETDADAGGFGIACFTADAEYSNAWADEDGQSTTDTQSLADNQAINFASGDGTTQHAATFVSLDNDGHTLNYSVADGTVRKWFELAIGAAAASGYGSADFLRQHYVRWRRRGNR